MNLNERVLVLTASQRDAESTYQIFLSAQINSVPCKDIEDLIRQIQTGAGAVILAKEVLTSKTILKLSEVLNGQPTWSFLPIIILIGAGDLALGNEETLRLLKPLRNRTLLERPVRIGTLTSVVQSALSDRKRQYEVRNLLMALETSKREAIAANQAKSVFLANMSHEIRTPLGAILGFSDFLLEPGLSEQEKKTYMTTIKRNSKLLSALIDDILDLAKVESGKIAIEKIDVSLHELMSEVIFALEPKAIAKKIPLFLRWDPSVARNIHTDPIRLKQILINIIGNAIKFTKEGQIEIRLFSSEDASQKQKLHIEVTDTGVGIPNEHLPNLFQPFTQADSSITRKFGGTGLGLVLSKKLAQALGGDLSLVKSEPNKGSRFHISIDISGSTEVEPKLHVHAKPIVDIVGSQPLKNCRILLVDDSLDNQVLISRLLKISGAEVETANDGIEGVEKAMSRKFDIVLMDIQMPRLGGREATVQLRQKGFAKPIIALTAHALKEDRDKCLELGCDYYLTKPVHRHELIQTVANYYNSEIAL